MTKIPTGGIMESIYTFVLAIAAAICISNIFNFKKRPVQILLNNIAIGLYVLLTGLLLYELLNLSGGKSDFPEKGIELAAPIIAIVMLLLANRYIKRDERLVKSADRIR